MFCPSPLHRLHLMSTIRCDNPADPPHRSSGAAKVVERFETPRQKAAVPTALQHSRTAIIWISRKKGSQAATSPAPEKSASRRQKTGDRESFVGHPGRSPNGFSVSLVFPAPPATPRQRPAHYSSCSQRQTFDPRRMSHDRRGSGRRRGYRCIRVMLLLSCLPVENRSELEKNAGG